MPPAPLKRLERAWRALLMRALAALLPRPAHKKAPDWDQRPYRILYLRYDRIGDMILATPLIRAIAESHSSFTVDVLASPANAAVLRGNPSVGVVRTFDVKSRSSYFGTLRELRRARYDVVVDDHAAMRKASLTMIFVMLATGARIRVGVTGQSNEFIYSFPVSPAPAGHQMEMAAVVATAFGVKPAMEGWMPTIFLSESERAAAAELWRVAESGHESSDGVRSRRFLVNISATHTKRRWPDEKFIETITEIRARYPDLVTGVIGSPVDAASIARVASAAGAAALRTPGIRDALALVESADLVLTPDTSITHAATAFETPVVVMLRPAMRHYLPYRVPYRAVWVDSDTFEPLPVAQVVQAVDGLLREISTIAQPA